MRGIKEGKKEIILSVIFDGACDSSDIIGGKF
jgi:hypothetical protein